MNGCGKSDGPVVPAKPTSKVAVATAEPVEERGSTEGNHGQQNASRTQCRARRVQCAGPCAAGGSTRQGGTVHRAVAPCDVDRLRDAYRAINPNAAPGVDEVTWAAYGQRTWRTTSVA